MPVRRAHEELTVALLTDALLYSVNLDPGLPLVPHQLPLQASKAEVLTPLLTHNSAVASRKLLPLLALLFPPRPPKGLE